MTVTSSASALRFRGPNAPKLSVRQQGTSSSRAVVPVKALKSPRIPVRQFEIPRPLSASWSKIWTFRFAKIPDVSRRMFGVTFSQAFSDCPDIWANLLEAYKPRLLKASKEGRLSTLHSILDGTCNRKHLGQDIIHNAFIEASKSGQIGSMKVLLAQKPSPKTINEALIAASQAGQPASLKVLLRHNPETIDEALLQASSAPVARLLVKAGASRAGIAGALAEMASKGNVPVAKELLKYDLSITAIDSAFIRAAHGGRLPMMKELLKHNPSDHTLSQACQYAWQDGVAELVYTEMYRRTPGLNQPIWFEEGEAV